MELFIKSRKLLNTIDNHINTVTTRFPNVQFEEYIVIPSLNNIVMLRFSNNDINQIDITELSKRENVIRQLVYPNFLANFIGEDYSKFGLELNSLKQTLINCDSSLINVDFSVTPNYFNKIFNDINTIKSLCDTDIDIWELQVHNDIVDVLHFRKNNINYNSTKLKFYNIDHDASFQGIIKAEIEAIKNKVSLLEILLKYQK